MTTVPLADANLVVANATVALAVLAGVALIANLVLLIINSLLAKQTKRAAEAAEQGIQLQRAEIEVVKRQLVVSERQGDLLSQQVAAELIAREGSYPLLRALLEGPVDTNQIRGKLPLVEYPDQQYLDGYVEYVSGTFPARNVQVWIAHLKVVYAAYFAVLGPQDTRVPFHAPWLMGRGGKPAVMPFPEFLEGPNFATLPAEIQIWIGVTWRRPDGKWQRHGRLLVDGQPYGLAIEGECPGEWDRYAPGLGPGWKVFDPAGN